jgi:hypothetical protein
MGADPRFVAGAPPERNAMSHKTMEFFRDRDVMVFLSTKEQPTIVEWDAYVAAITALATPSGPLRGILVVSDGGGPDARQRAQVVKAFGDHSVPLAICSASALERGIVTAMRWIYRAKVASFGFDDVGRALAFLGVEAARWPGIAEQIRGAQRKQGWHVVSAGATA